MTGDNRALRRLVAGVGLVLLAGAWVFAATRLWDTSVPGDLTLPSLDPADYFTDAQLQEADEYATFLRIDHVVALVAQLLTLGFYARWGARYARESAAGRIGTGMLLGMLGFGFVWLAQFPFSLAGLWWERRHDISDQGYVEWAVNDFMTVGGEFLFICLMLLIVMGIAGLLRRSWWLAAAPVLLAVGLVFAFVQPYLLPDQHVVRDPQVTASARQLAEEQGIPDTTVRVQDTHGLTNAANAMATGLGSSRRVVLWDTLLERFPANETRVVVAHELGHLSRHHIWKHVAWFALLAIPIGFAVAFATRGRGGIYNPAAIPLALFAMVVVVTLLSPLQAAFTRRLEAEADWIALQTAQDPGSATGLFRRFTRGSLVDPDPPGWSIVFEDHPTIMRRIEMAEAWRERYGR